MVMPALSAALLLLGATTSIDEIGLLRVDPTGKNSPISLELHEVATSGLDVMKSDFKLDSKIGKAAGKKQLRFSFGADWDGDGLDEIVLGFVQTSDPELPLELIVYRSSPNNLFNLSKPVASLKPGALKLAGAFRATTIGPIDFNGDGKSELAVVRVPPIGEERIEIYSLPKGLGKKLGKVIASDWTFGGATEDNVSVFGVDIDADGSDELAALRRVAGGSDRLYIFEQPKFPIAEIGPPVLSDDAVSPADGAVNRTALQVRRNGPYPVRIGFLRQGVDGTHRIDVHALPAASGGDIGAPLATQGPLDGAAGEPVFGAFALRHAQPLPWIPLEGEMVAHYFVAYKLEDNSIKGEWIGPFPGLFSGADPDQTTLTVEFPPEPNLPDPSMDGNLTGWDLGAKANWEQKQFWFTVVADTGIAKAGDWVVMIHPQGTIVADGTGKRIEYFNANWAATGALSMGEVQVPVPGGTPLLRAAIFGYRYSKKK